MTILLTPKHFDHISLYYFVKAERAASDHYRARYESAQSLYDTLSDDDPQELARRAARKSEQDAARA